jgi:hypothetical protein
MKQPNAQGTVPLGPELTTPEQHEFYHLCKAHDLTYSYSDDYGVWRRGAESLVQLQEYAKVHLRYAVARRIWNAVVDEKLVEGARESFYWPGRR